MCALDMEVEAEPLKCDEWEGSREKYIPCELNGAIARYDNGRRHSGARNTDKEKITRRAPTEHVI